MYIDDCRLKGVVNLVLRDENGKVKQHKTIRNKVTKDGIAHIIGRMIDDGQDRAGKHKMPRMMSHMAIGIGAAAREARDRYIATDFDNIPTVTGITDPSGTNLKTARKQAAIPKSYDRMLQDERGFRVQLMKDTTLASDYVPLINVHLEQDGSTAMHATDGSGNSQLIFVTGSDNGNTLKRLRVGLQVTGLTGGTSNTGPVGGSSDNVKNAQTIKIAKIESGTPNSTATTVTLDGALITTPNSANTDIHIDVEYVDRIPLTSYNISPAHPTHTAVRSVFEVPAGGSNLTGPFAAAAADTNRTRGATNSADYNENGLGMLGIARGQIGAFYEREIEYNINLAHTDSSGLPDNTAGLSVATTIDEAAFAVLDSGVARFPFIGAEEDKPSGTTAVGAPTGVGNNTITGNNVRGTEFIQFGTAVDGIFQGALVGSSIVANDKDGTAEGYPPEENNYGVRGGLTITGAAGDALAAYGTFLSYDFAGGSYAPNAVAGAKKNGDRIVYVATFKENNPRPEQDYDRFNASAGVSRAPLNRIYPITEAGIFNKHIPDLGIFDVGDRSYTGSDANNSELAHIDTRLGVSKPSSGTSINYTLTGGTDHPPVEGVLTQDGKTVTAAAHGFTRGPLTQTMLCRTTFDPVNKATADTLQITWSVQLQDLT